MTASLIRWYSPLCHLMVRHSNFVLRLQLFLLKDWAVVFTVFYLAVTTETAFNGAHGLKNLMKNMLTSSEIYRDKILNNCCR